MLQKQVVPVDLTGGLDTKTDAKLVIPGKLRALSNARFVGGTLAKRYGYEALGNLYAHTGNTLAGAHGLGQWRGHLLRWVGADACMAMPATLLDSGRWGGAIANAAFYTARKSPVLRSHSAQQGYDVAESGAFRVLCWREVAGGSQYTWHYLVTDVATGAVVLPPSLLHYGASTGAAPRLAVVTEGSAAAVPTVVALWTDGASLYSAQMRMDAPTGFDYVRVERGDYGGATDGGLYAVASGATLEIVYAHAGGGGFAYTLTSLAVATGAHSNVVATAVGLGGASALGLLRFADGSLGVLHTGTTGLALRRHSNLHVALGVTVQVVSAVGASLTSQAAWASADGGVTYRVWAMVSDGNTVHHTYSAIVTAAAESGGSTGAMGCRPIAQACVVGGRFLLPVAYAPLPAASTDVQPTAYVLDVTDTTQVAARLLDGVHTPLAAGVTLPSSPASATAARFHLLEKGRVVLESDSVAYSEWTRLYTADRTPSGVSLLEVTPASAAEVSQVEAGGVLHVAGAAPLLYDGMDVTECGFHAFPQRIAAGDSATAGSLVPGATYRFCAVYEWTDAAGNRHQSAPSPSVALTLGVGFTSAVVEGPMLGLTRHLGGTANAAASVVVYRTEASGTTYYRTTSVAAPTTMDPFSTKWSLNDGTADAALIGNEVLYTTGGALEALPPPAHTFAWVHDGRLWLGGLEDRQDVRYSCELLQGEGPVFSDALAFRIPEARGALTAGASMDGRCVLFTEKGVGVIHGEGPNLNGEGNNYSEIQWLLTDVGCTSWRTVVEVPAGLLFHSGRGIHLLTRSLDVQYVGADAEAYNGLAFTRAVRLEDVREVRFLTAAGPTVVFNYEYGTWGTHSYGATDALVHDGRLVRTDGTTVLRESPALWADDGAAYGWSFRTAHLNPNVRQGVERVWRLLLLGRVEDAVSLTGNVYLDWDEADARDTFTGTPAPGAVPGQDVLQVRHHLARQRCQALQLEVAVAASATEGLAFTSLALELGFKRGAARLPPAQTF